jgi:hypothetical protein
MALNDGNENNRKKSGIVMAAISAKKITAWHQ